MSLPAAVFVSRKEMLSDWAAALGIFDGVVAAVLDEQFDIREHQHVQDLASILARRDFGLPMKIAQGVSDPDPALAQRSHRLVETLLTDLQRAAPALFEAAPTNEILLAFMKLARFPQGWSADNRATLAADIDRAQVNTKRRMLVEAWNTLAEREAKKDFDARISPDRYLQEIKSRARSQAMETAE